jgi:hypothetical protein
LNHPSFQDKVAVTHNTGWTLLWVLVTLSNRNWALGVPLSALVKTKIARLSENPINI